MLTNIDQGLHGRKVNIHNPLTSLLCFGTPLKWALLTTQLTPSGCLNSRLTTV